MKNLVVGQDIIEETTEAVVSLEKFLNTINRVLIFEMGSPLKF